jgi:hypothetical protein
MTPAIIDIVMITTPDVVGANGEARPARRYRSRQSKSAPQSWPWERSFPSPSVRIAGRLPFSCATILAMMRTRASPPAVKSP